MSSGGSRRLTRRPPVVLADVDGFLCTCWRTRLCIGARTPTARGSDDVRCWRGVRLRTAPKVRTRLGGGAGGLTIASRLDAGRRLARHRGRLAGPGAALTRSLRGAGATAGLSAVFAHARQCHTARLPSRPIPRTIMRRTLKSGWGNAGALSTWPARPAAGPPRPLRKTTPQGRKVCVGTNRSGSRQHS